MTSWASMVQTPLCPCKGDTSRWTPWSRQARLSKARRYPVTSSFKLTNANSCHTRWSSNLVRHVIWAPYKVHIKTHKPNTLVCCIILYALLQFRKCLEVQSVSENHVWEGGETASKAESTTKRRVETVPPLPSASLVPSKGRLQRLKTEPHRKDTRKKALRMSSR